MSRIIDQDRVAFDGPDTLTPVLGMVGWARFRRAAPGNLGPHIHRNMYELCLIVRGTVEWWAGEEVWEVGPGSMYVTFPGERHGGVGAVMNPCELYWAQVRVSGSCALAGMSVGETRRLAGEMTRLRPRVFPAEAGVEAVFAGLLGEHRVPDRFSGAVARGAVSELLVRTLRSAGTECRRQDERGQRVSPPVARAVAMIEAEPGYRLTVAGLAERLGLSEVRLRELFVRDLGCSPKPYLTRRRIQAARSLLRDGWPVTRVAMRLGFSSSQHMATAFGRSVGLTPTAYAMMARSASAAWR